MHEEWITEQQEPGAAVQVLNHLCTPSLLMGVCVGVVASMISFKGVKGLEFHPDLDCIVF